LLSKLKIKMENAEPKKKAGRKSKQKFALAKANQYGEVRRSTQEKGGNQAVSAFSSSPAPN
jgi:hypothetical protein